MTAPTPEKIQRWTTMLDAPLVPKDDGEILLYSDHLRHLKLAQIAVLEELIAHMRSRYTSEANPTGSYCNEESLWIGDKIQKLRREIEG